MDIPTLNDWQPEKREQSLHDRARKMLERYLRGEMLREIGASYGISRERVRQIIGRFPEYAAAVALHIEKSRNTVRSASGSRPRITSMGGFNLGQRVRFTELGRALFPRTRSSEEGVVVSIRDLSYCIPTDNPPRNRNFSLRVRLDSGSKASYVEGNGAAFAPL